MILKKEDTFTYLPAKMYIPKKQDPSDKSIIMLSVNLSIIFLLKNTFLYDLFISCIPKKKVFILDTPKN